MTDLNLNEVLVLALALEIIEISASVSEIPDLLKNNRFITTKSFNAYDLYCIRRKHLELSRELFNERQLRAVQIKNVLEYLEENTVYVPEDFGKVKAKEEISDHATYSLRELRALVTNNPEILDRTKW